MKALKALFCGKTWKGSLVRILLLLTICVIPFWYHYRIVYVNGISMTPTYDDGQWTLMQRIRSLDTNWAPDRFDVVVVWDDKHKVRLCKRVIGLPGEIVDVVQGRIFIDGKQLSDSFGKGYMVYRNFIDPDTEESWFKEYDNIKSETVKEGEVWVIGDNREDSFYGHFPINKICGKIVLY